MSTTSDRSLRSLLDEVHRGSIQVPEFQRALSIKDDWIRSLLASVSLGYSIGAIMLLEAGEPGLRFAAHPVPGVPVGPSRPEWYVVDGQYRLAALYAALVGDDPIPVLDADNRPVRRRYYVDLDLVARPDVDRDQAVRAIDPDDQPRPEGLIGFGQTFTSAADGSPLELVRSYVIPTIQLPRASTRWTVRVHGGADGPALSDRYRV